ncbi:WW domain-containing adapter protein with coiled-coil-like isoform X2 [Argopecten irradians]|uniref:WW domain-containing adapter protein with coiled-coil-like isoform X2 n=1 Tax=Argopecten irradians TaxID=31199 RepID=UPI0037234028
MVMHARKQPRLDDGYMEKRDAHPFQSSQYPSKNYGIDSYADRYKRDGGSSDRCRDNSPSSRLSPRYHNKSSYSEKVKERYEKGSSSFPDRKANHSYSNQRSNNQNGNYDKGVKNPRDVKEGKSESQKTAGRTCGDWSEHVSSSGMHYYYNCKTEVSQWEKPKDWTDGPGSKPDVKPNNYSRSGSGNSGGAKHSYPSKSTGFPASTDKSKHSSNAADRTLLSEKNLKRSMSDINPTYPHSGKPDKKYIIEKFQASQHLAVEQQHLRGGPSQSHHHRTDHKPDSATMFHRKEGSGTYPDPQGSQANRRYRRNSEGNRSYSGGGGGGGAQVTPRKHNHDSQIDDMDISPGSSPSSSRRSSCAGTPQLGASSTPMSLPTSTAAALAGIAPTALQTLQRLQEVISRQIAQQTSPGNPPQQSPRSTSDVPITQTAHQQSVQNKPHQHPHHHHHHPHHHQPNPSPSPHNSNLLLSPQSSHHPTPHTDNNSHHHHPAGQRDPPHTPGGHSSSSVYGKLNQISRHDEDHHMTGPGGGGGESPLSETSQGPSCLSPGSSTTSSQTAAVAQAELSAAGITKETSMGINPALKNYYNERLIGHVLGWQAEHAERQAKKYRQENLTIDCMRCSQVSVELKRARSLVRIAEIQSTLHEQRILFLAQQIHELENMKPPSFSSSQSFTSSSHS